MKNLLVYFLVSVSLMACTTPAPTTETAAPIVSTVDRAELEIKLKGMEAAWNLSATDEDHGLKYLQEIIADDFLNFNNEGVKQNKAEFIKSLSETKETITEVVNGEMHLTFYSDNVAIIVGSHVSKGKDMDGKAFTKTSFWTDTYMERNGTWQAIASGSRNITSE